MLKPYVRQALNIIEAALDSPGREVPEDDIVDSHHL